MSSPWRDPHTGTYYLRKRVPQRFRHVAGKGDIRKISLGTGDAAEAKRRWPEALEKWGRLEAEWTKALSAVAITPERAKEIAAGWAAWLANGGTLDMGGEDDSVFAPWVEKALRTPERMARMHARIAAHTDEALRLAGDHSVTPETLPLLRREIALAAMHAYVQGPLSGMRITNPKQPLRTHFDAFRTTLPPVAQAPDMPPPETARVTFKALFDAWSSVAVVSERTKRETLYILDMLKAFVGHDDAARVSRADMLRWRDATKADGKTNNTWNNRLSMLRQIFDHAIASDMLPASPADNTLRLKKSKASSPLPYTDEEAVRILTAARKEKRASLRWAHWVMAFTGMRVGEVLQLRGGDIKRDGAVWYIDVNERTPDKSVKNSLPRYVPLHPALIGEGFLAYAQTVAADAPLFPDKKLDRHGKRGGRAWQVVGRWVRHKVGITDADKAPDHSWRHRMQDELRAAGVGRDVRDALEGHASKTTGRLYGVRGEALSRLHRELAKVPSPFAQKEER